MKEGETAPDFQLDSQEGRVSLESFRGKKNVVLCFYPKNRIFGCPSKKSLRMTRSLSASYRDILDVDSVLFAISTDTAESQKKFVGRYGIPYPHLGDPEKGVCRRFAGLNMVGLARRATIVIDKKGVVRKVFRGMDVERHGTEILDFVKGLS